MAGYVVWKLYGKVRGFIKDDQVWKTKKDAQKDMEGHILDEQINYIEIDLDKDSSAAEGRNGRIECIKNT